MLEGEAEPVCKVSANVRQTEHVSDFKCLGLVLDESDTEPEGCFRKIMIGKKLGV